jgi:signal transduction histidine kinase
MHDRGRIIERDAAGRPLRIGGTSQDASARKALERELADAASREQRRLSYDLHDGLGQELTGVQFLLSGVARRLASGRRVEGPKSNRLRPSRAARSRPRDPLLKDSRPRA